MMLRWVAAGVLEAVKGFRRLKGHADMPTLVSALRARDRQLGRAPAEEDRQVASSSPAPPPNLDSRLDVPMTRPEPRFDLLDNVQCKRATVDGGPYAPPTRISNGSFLSTPTDRATGKSPPA